MTQKNMKPLLSKINDRDSDEFTCTIGICYSSSSASMANVSSKNTNDSYTLTSMADYVYNMFTRSNDYDTYKKAIIQRDGARIDIALECEGFAFDKNEYFDIVGPFIENTINNNNNNIQQDSDDVIKICHNQDNKFNCFAYNNKLILWVLSKNEQKYPNPDVESRNMFYVDFRIKKLRGNMYEIEHHIVIRDMDYRNKKIDNKQNPSVFEYLNDKCEKDIMKT